MIAVLTNVGVCIFTSGAFDQESFETKFGYFILIEHCVLVLQFGIKYGVTKWNENLIHTRRDNWVLKELGSLSARHKKKKNIACSDSEEEKEDEEHFKKPIKKRAPSSSKDNSPGGNNEKRSKKKLISSLSKRVRQPREIQ